MFVQILAVDEQGVYRIIFPFHIGEVDSDRVPWCPGVANELGARLGNATPDYLAMRTKLARLGRLILERKIAVQSIGVCIAADDQLELRLTETVDARNPKPELARLAAALSSAFGWDVRITDEQIPG